MKGASIIVSAILGMAIMLAILGVITFAITNYYTNVSEQSQLAEAESIASDLSAEIIDMHNSHSSSGRSPSVNESITIAESDVSLPAKISGNDYSVTLLPRGEYWSTIEITASEVEVEEISSDREYASIKIETLGRNQITFTLPMTNLPITVEGRSVGGGLVTLSYVRINDGTETTDKIVLS